jgi:uncharacterized SAM-binding protein YcdF (DUF218 family)
VRSKRRLLTGLAIGGLAGLIAQDLGLASTVSFWGDPGPLVAVSAFVGAILWPSVLRHLVGSITAALALLWLVVAFTPLAAWLASDLARYDALVPADAIFVAASGIQQSGNFTPASMSRIVHGLELLSQGKAPALVVSDLQAPYPSYAEPVGALMNHLRIDREVLIVGPVANTRDEAVALGQLYRKRGWKRVIVVTSPYHSRRACSTVAHEGVDVVCSPSVETGFDVAHLDRSEERRHAFSSAIHEQIGLWVYRRRGWLAPL